MSKKIKKLKFYNGINRYLIKFVPDNSVVLDVGCSSGLLGKYLKEYKNCTVYGVDIHKESINIAKKYLDDVKVMDIVFDNIPFRKKFDVIVFGDVLEHTPYPQDVLTKFRKYLKSDGFIIVSIPNIANISTRLGLLMGNWDYKDTGLLDFTHLRFFTRKTAISLLSDSGFKIIQIDYTPTCFFFIPESMRNLEYYLTKIWPTILSLQFIFVAKKI